jgi:biotin transport system substrate-specific component
MLAGNVVIYLGGIAWLAAFVEGGALMIAGVLPFIPGDLLKIALAAAALPGAWALVRRIRPDADEPAG